ncbi:MAG TPA: hypothetical protein VEP28_00030 [Rubrobacter sp.]|nr:hypothetical protein [Rubrobacter sp.]
MDLHAALEPPPDTAGLLDIVPELYLASGADVGYAAGYLKLLAARRLGVEDPGGGRVDSRRERSHSRGRRR